MGCDMVWDVPPKKIIFNESYDWPTYVPEPPTCIMEPDGYYGEHLGIFKCSNCGEPWQFEFDGPIENGWKRCPKCGARIKGGSKARRTPHVETRANLDGRTKQTMGKKRKRGKVKLPCDSTGEPIHIGDVLEWSDGQRLKVAYMTYYGKGAKGNVYWTAEDEDGGSSDNLGASTIVRRG